MRITLLVNALKETLEIVLPVELFDVMDKTIKLTGFKSRENLAEVAVRRFLDRYRTLLKSADQEPNPMPKDALAGGKESMTMQEWLGMDKNSLKNRKRIRATMARSKIQWGLRGNGSVSHLISKVQLERST
jgi:hypothetical protein